MLNTMNGPGMGKADGLISWIRAYRGHRTEDGLDFIVNEHTLFSAG